MSLVNLGHSVAVCLFSADFCKRSLPQIPCWDSGNRFAKEGPCIDVRSLPQSFDSHGMQVREQCLAVATRAGESAIESVGSRMKLPDRSSLI